MDWDGVGLEDRVLAWLETTSQSKQTKERRLDPFATSMRDLDDVTVNLQSIRAGTPLTHSDQVQRVTDLRGAGLVEGPVGTVALTELGNATLDSWLKYDVANDSMTDEFARTLLLAVEGRRLENEAYISFVKYWAELRSSFDPYKLINNWDALFTLNYLDNTIDGFAPGSAFRDEKIPADIVEYDLDDFVAQVDASENIRAGADQVARAIVGKIPRGRARATFCIALELMAAPQTDPLIVLQAFGHPKRPRQWTAFNKNQITKIITILADIGIAPVHGGGAPTSADTLAEAPVTPIKLPTDIDFEAALRAPPKPPVRKVRAKTGAGQKKIDYKRRQERNDIVGRTGEEFALRYEQWRLRDHPKLAEKIEHVALDDDTLGYDIKSFELDGSTRLVEVKATQGPLETRFFMSAGEKKFAEENPGEYVIVRVGNLEGVPILCELRSPFNELEFLTSVYEVHFIPVADTA